MHGVLKNALLKNKPGRHLACRVFVWPDKKQLANKVNQFTSLAKSPGSTPASVMHLLVGTIRQRIRFFQLWFSVLLTAASHVMAAEKPVTADVCIYGGTSGGVIAAVQAARMGKRTIIVDPGRHLGGMTSGGLSAVDIGDPRTVGGLTREYFTRLVATYGKKLAWDKPFESKHGGPATGGAYSIEPHVAEKVFDDMAKEAGVRVYFNGRLAKVQKRGATITGFTTEDGREFHAKMFIDTTYEGDLMAAAGVSYTVMREGNAKYGEQYNGIHYNEKFKPRTNHLKPGPNGRVPGGQGVWDRDLPLDPYVIPGDPKSGLLPLVQAGDPGKEGDPAPGVQAYCYRLCLTTNANRIAIAPPPGYDPKRYELVARFIAGCLKMGDDMDLRWFSKFDPLPNGKFDFNTATFGGNLPGASWAWPEASYTERDKIAKEHENYHRGLLHFLATDSRVPVKVREEVKRFGLPRDEFTDNGGWPHQIYVREGRRMVSDLVLTENHTFGRQIAPHSISLGSYGTDTHEIRRIVKDGVVTREGKTAGGRGGFGPYQIGYGAIIPKAKECDNLFVTFALSASHTAFSSIRMEPVFMVSSQSAATAACIAIDDQVPVQKVDYPKLRKRLDKDGQIVEWHQTKKPAAKKTKTAAPKAQPAKPKTSAQNKGAFELRVEAPGPEVYADDILQKAIDEVAANGGGVVLLGAGDFKLSRHSGDETVVIKSNITLRGQGYATHIYFDPTTPPNPLRYFPIRIGTGKTPANNVVIENVRYTGNDKKIGGGSVMGFNARLDDPSALLLSCDNVTIRNCWIYDAKQAAGCTKPAATMYEAKHVISPDEALAASLKGTGSHCYADDDRVASQFKNWQVHHNFIDTSGNKAIELAECNGGLIADNYITNAVDGPQVIFGSRNVQISDNTVFFTKSGINITEGSNHIRVSGNHVEPVPSINKSTVGPCLLFRTEPLPMNSVVSQVVVTGNIFRNQTTKARCAARFQTRKEALSCTFQGITFTGNVFDGDMQFLDPTSPAKTTIRDIVFADNVCEGDILSVPANTMKSARVLIRGNMLRKTGDYILKANQWVWSGNIHTAGTLEIAQGVTGNFVHDNTTVSAIADHGTDTHLANNLVIAQK